MAILMCNSVEIFLYSFPNILSYKFIAFLNQNLSFNKYKKKIDFLYYIYIYIIFFHHNVCCIYTGCTGYAANTDKSCVDTISCQLCV
jgi:hypothetical protein